MHKILNKSDHFDINFRLISLNCLTSIMTKHSTKSNNLKPLSDDEAMNDFDFTNFISQSLCLMLTFLFFNLNKVFHQLEQISVVFHQYETGVRSGTIRPGVCLVSST